LPFPPSGRRADKALACEFRAGLGPPLSRVSRSELRRYVLAAGIVAEISGVTIWRWLHQDALRPCSLEIPTSPQRQEGSSTATFSTAMNGTFSSGVEYRGIGEFGHHDVGRTRRNGSAEGAGASSKTTLEEEVAALLGRKKSERRGWWTRRRVIGTATARRG
jgi:hypothetical protein